MPKVVAPDLIKEKSDDQKYYENLVAKRKHIATIEKNVKKKPTNLDLNNAIKVLKQFGIKMKISDIPDLPNVAALHRWKQGVIKENL